MSQPTRAQYRKAFNSASEWLRKDMGVTLKEQAEKTGIELNRIHNLRRTETPLSPGEIELYFQHFEGFEKKYNDVLYNKEEVFTLESIVKELRDVSAKLEQLTGEVQEFRSDAFKNVQDLVQSERENKRLIIENFKKSS